MRILFAIIFVLFIVTSSYSENLFVMGWDGAGKINIDRLLQEGKLPNLQAFINGGACYMPLESLGYTISIANWGVLFTGLTYDQSGILGNAKYVRGTSIDTAYNFNHYVVPGLAKWLYVIPYNYTIIRAIDDKGHKIGWFVSKNSLSSLENCTPLAKIAQNADSYRWVDAQQNPQTYIEEIGQETVNFISTNNDYFIFLHVNPDHFGHTYGENSLEYENEFIRADYWLGMIMSVINRSNTKVIIVTDHGFDEGLYIHANASDLWWATDLPVKNIYRQGEAIGTVRDLSNTILSYYGVDWKSRTPKLRGKSLIN